MVHEEHGGLGDLGRPPVDLDPVEPVDVDPLVQAHVQGQVLGPGAAALVGQQVRLDLAQLGVGQVQEVAGPAGRVDVDVGGHLLDQADHLTPGGGLVLDEPVRAGAVLVQEERADGLEDVLLGGVVLSVPAAGLLGLDQLEHGAEYGRGDLGPPEPAGGHERVPEVVGEEAGRGGAVEDAAVDVGEAGQRVRHAAAPVLWGVEHAEERVELGAEVVGGGVPLHPTLEQVGLPQAGVVSVEQEQQPGEQDRGLLGGELLLFGVLGGLLAHGHVHLVPDEGGEHGGHQLRGRDGGLLFLGLGHGVPAGQKHQLVHVIGGVLHRELGHPAGLAQTFDTDAGEVGDQHVLGPLVLTDGSASQVVQGLVVGDVEVRAQGLGLAQGDTGPEEVDVAGPTGGGARGPALEQVDALGDHLEGAQQVGPELLGEGLLRVGLSIGPPAVDALTPGMSEVVQGCADDAAICKLLHRSKIPGVP